MNTVSAAPRLVKSWFGLVLGLLCTALSATAWWETRSAGHVASVLAFVCLTVVWSQMRLSLKTPLKDTLKAGAPMSRMSCVNTVLTWVGLGLLLLSIALRWLV